MCSPATLGRWLTPSRPQIGGNTCSFDLDRPRYLLVFPNEVASFGAAGLMLFAEPPEKNPPKLGDPNVVNIMDYKVDNTGKTVETAKINRPSATSPPSLGRRALFPHGRLHGRHAVYEEQRQALRGRGRPD